VLFIKKLCAWLVMLLICSCLFGIYTVKAGQNDVSVYEVTVDNLIYKVDMQKVTATVTSAKSKKIKKIVIPDTIVYEETEIPVEAVADYAFFESKKLKSAVIGCNVKSIGEAAFAFSLKLKKVSIPEEVEEIGDAAFAGCSILKSSGIGKNTKLKRIGAGAFAGTAFKSFTIPDYTDIVGAAVFNGCGKLKKIYIGTNCEVIGEGAFSGCDKLTTVSLSKYNRSFNIIDGVIYNADCSKLVSAAAADGELTVPDGVLCILPYAFEDESRIISVILPDSLTDIEENAFLNAEGLEHISFGLGLKRIGLNAFYGCSGLKTVELQMGEDKIEGYPFLDTDDGIQVIQG